MAGHPDVAIGFRSVVRGRMSYVARHLMASGGEGLRVEDGRFVFGWACEGRNCAKDGLFLGYDARTERFYLILLDEGDATLTIPPRGAPWPGVLARAVLAVRPDIRRLEPERE
ncbi:hypothetical protein [Muricoccus radiodurans]|uniref:hypothetical protein n=1 Tax=Muricoccus radiodurans TaxID=2231721 RepID=UPI003CFBB11A